MDKHSIISFNSILDLRESPCKEEPRPAFFSDLNIDQIIDRICADWGENVSSLYSYLPADAACEDYRREIYGDMELDGLYDALCAFIKRMDARREAFVKKEDVSAKMQKAVWHIRETEEYCRAFGELYQVMERMPFRSRGMTAFRDFLGKYLAGERYLRMRREAGELLEELSTFRMVVTYENDRMTVAQGETEGAYDAFLERYFPGQKKRMKSPFEAMPELTELEEELLKGFQKKNAGFFAGAEAFYGNYELYAEDVLIRFASEIRYYLSFYCFERKMQERGFSFCVPVILDRPEPSAFDASGILEEGRAAETPDKEEVVRERDRENKKSKTPGGRGEMHAEGLYDLALACAHAGGNGSGQEIVSNCLEYRAGEKFFVLTGPNQGGKTTFARSLGQMIFLSKMGLNISADSAAIYRFSGISTHFSVEESVETGRGKLMDELMRLAPMMDASCEGNFVIINELFTTAANYDACIMGKRVLEHFLRQDCMGIYVTHLAELSEVHPQIVSLRAMVDSQGVRSYKIRRERAVDYANAATQVSKYGLTYGQLRERLEHLPCR